MDRNSISYRNYYEVRLSYGRAVNKTWDAVCKYVSQYIDEGSPVVDVGAGRCVAINRFKGKQLYAIDIADDCRDFANPNVNVVIGDWKALERFPDNYFGSIFCSNFLEHLSHNDVEQFLALSYQKINSGGNILFMQPNFKYAYRDYYNDHTHISMHDHVGLSNRLRSIGFEIVHIESRFLPFSFKSRLSIFARFTAIYLKLPFKPFAKQMLIVASKEISQAKGKRIG